jgi:hypothetical protein
MESYGYCVISGNPFDGFRHFGPFHTFEGAEAWAGKNLHGSGVEWWIGTLEQEV